MESCILHYLENAPTVCDEI